MTASQSIYLLGQKTQPPLLQRHFELMERCKLGGEFLSFETTSDWLACYARDAQPLCTQSPLLVFRPHTISDIAPFLHACHHLEIPVTTRCGGTGLSGNCVPAKEGVVLLTGHFHHIKNYNSQQGTLSLEPGVTVRQLNNYVLKDGWHFPLSMATEGVAGIAGCLSCHARGYHQQQHSLYNIIEQVTVIDGHGEVVDVPFSLVCGGEGLWGVIIEISMRLKRIPEKTACFYYKGNWDDVWVQLSALRSLHALTEVIWLNGCFYFQLKGEGWRLPSAIAFLKTCLVGVEQSEQPLEELNKTFLPSRKNFAAIGSLFYSDQVVKAVEWSKEQSEALKLECFQMVDLLSGSLHLILQTADDLYSFSQKMKQFLVLWADFVDAQKGVLASTHGVGMQLHHYMPPFWTEESQCIWRKLQSLFDPKELFSQERFFPVVGKSLEKVNPLNRSIQRSDAD